MIHSRKSKIIPYGWFLITYAYGVKITSISNDLKYYQLSVIYHDIYLY